MAVTPPDVEIGPVPPPPRSRVPWWACVIACCGCGVLFVPIVAAILFPVFARAREKARAQTCLTNLHSYAAAIAMYASDNDEHLPAAERWMDACASVGVVPESLRCPSVRGEGPGAYGYAFDSGLSQKSLGEIADPKQEIDIYDSTNLSRNATDPGTSLPIPARHLRRNNAGFVDGHARAVDASVRGGAPAPDSGEGDASGPI